MKRKIPQPINDWKTDFKPVEKRPFPTTGLRVKKEEEKK